MWPLVSNVISYNNQLDGSTFGRYPLLRDAPGEPLGQANLSRIINDESSMDTVPASPGMRRAITDLGIPIRGVARRCTPVFSAHACHFPHWGLSQLTSRLVDKYTRCKGDHGTRYTDHRSWTLLCWRPSSNPIRNSSTYQIYTQVKNSPFQLMYICRVIRSLGSYQLTKELLWDAWKLPFQLLACSSLVFLDRNFKL